MMSIALQPVRRLRPLLEGVVALNPGDDREISGLSLDSRQVCGGGLFFGLPGAGRDGRCFIGDAIAAGAVTVLYEQTGWASDQCRPGCYPVTDLSHRIGHIASRFYGFPSRILCAIGVTGTNGKTTCAALLAQALGALGRHSGFIGTVGWGMPGSLEATAMTTPDALTLQAQLAQLATQGADSVCIEVSSHALVQGRVEGVEFDVALFTNLSRDHLDYHQNMDDYAAAKLLLFQTNELRSAIINASDPWGVKFAQAGLSTQVWTFGTRAPADVYPLSSDLGRDGMRLTLATPHGEMAFCCPLLGSFNVANVVAVVTTLLALDYAPEVICRIMPGLASVPGRMQMCAAADGAAPMVVVDYAHTPAALAQALDTLDQQVTGELWCVFGCGGDRDQGKRPQMGEVAGRCADHVVLTSDNPRSEDPDRILADIAAGMRATPAAVLADRRAAIAFAIDHAGADDLVLIAGKGHETHQVIADKVIPFDDRVVAEELLGVNRC